MYITPFYAAILALVFFMLSVRTVRLRRQTGILIGAGGNPAPTGPLAVPRDLVSARRVQTIRQRGHHLPVHVVDLDGDSPIRTVSPCRTPAS